MANPVWDALVTYITWSGGTTTTSFNIAKNAGAITIIMPTLATDTVSSIQGLNPFDKTTWSAVEALDLVAGGGLSDPVQVGSAKYVVIPASALGAGTFRLSNATSQTVTLRATIIIDRIV